MYINMILNISPRFEPETFDNRFVHFVTQTINLFKRCFNFICEIYEIEIISLDLKWFLLARSRLSQRQMDKMMACDEGEVKRTLQ